MKNEKWENTSNKGYPSSMYPIPIIGDLEWHSSIPIHYSQWGCNLTFVNKFFLICIIKDLDLKEYHTE